MGAWDGFRHGGWGLRDMKDVRSMDARSRDGDLRQEFGDTAVKDIPEYRMWVFHGILTEIQYDSAE